MKSLEAVLDPKIFQRVHRSTIVNVRRVRRLRPHANGEYFLTLEDGQEIKLSRSYRDRVDQLLQTAVARLCENVNLPRPFWGSLSRHVHSSFARR